MLTSGTIVSDVSQPPRTSASRTGAERSGEFGETLSAVAQEERSPRDDDQSAESDMGADDGDAAESVGTRTTSRLALSFLHRAGEVTSAQPTSVNGQPSATDISLAGLKFAGKDLSAESAEDQTVVGMAEALKGRSQPAGEALASLAQPGSKAATAGASSELEAQMASLADGSLDVAGEAGVNGKIKKATSGEGNDQHEGKVTNASKRAIADPEPETPVGQATDASADAALPAAESRATSEGEMQKGEVQNSAQAVATLLSGLSAAELAQPQLKASSRGDTVSAKSDKDSTFLSGSAALEGSDLLDTALAKDALDKDILKQSVAADENEKRSFRLTSAHGGRSLDMTIGTDQSGKATFDTSTKTSGAETVTVLDSRRYLGFTQSTNGAALTSVISGDSEWQKAMQPGATAQSDQARAGTSNVVNTLKLQMTPIDLGTVTATLRLVGEELSVHLTVETRAAHQQLSDDSSGILGALRAQGFSVDQVTVTMSSQDSNAQMSGDGQQRPADANAQQGNSQSQGQSSGRSEASVKYGSNETEAGPETRPHSSDSAGGTSDIYL